MPFHGGVDFEGRHPEKPYVLGVMYNSEKGNKSADNVKDYPKMSSASKTNDLKIIKTRSGHTIELNDKKGEETITIKDKAQNIIVLDVKKKTITIAAPDEILLSSKVITISGSNRISLNSSNVFVTGEDMVKLKSLEEIKLETDKVVDIDAGESFILMTNSIFHISKPLLNCY